MRRSQRQRHETKRRRSDNEVALAVDDDIVPDFDDEDDSSPDRARPSETRAPGFASHDSSSVTGESQRSLSRTLERNGVILTDVRREIRLPLTPPPGTIPDLVMAPVTTNKVRKWLATVFSSDIDAHPHVLLLTGPPGTGKSTAIRLVAKELDCEVLEWRAPLVVGSLRSTTHALVDSVEEFLVGFQYPSLIQSGKKSYLTESGHEYRRLLLFDDLPHSLAMEGAQHQNYTRFEQLIVRTASNCNFPMVIIASDSSKGRPSSSRGLVSRLTSSENVLTVHVPPATENAMRRVLQATSKRRNIEILPDSLNFLIDSSHGDIRAALNSLRLYSTEASSSGKIDPARPSAGPDSLSAQSAEKLKRSSTKRPRSVRASKQSSTVDHVPGVGGDATLDMFHAVSKVLNNKRRGDGRSKYDPEELLAVSGAEPGQFVSFLHQNYPRFFKQYDDAAEALDLLSDCSQMLEWRLDDISRTSLRDCAASVITRGFLLHNSNPIRNGWRPVQGAESFLVQKAAETRLAAGRLARGIGNPSNCLERRGIGTDSFMTVACAMELGQGTSESGHKVLYTYPASFAGSSLGDSNGVGGSSQVVEDLPLKIPTSKNSIVDGTTHRVLCAGRDEHAHDSRGELNDDTIEEWVD